MKGKEGETIDPLQITTVGVKKMEIVWVNEYEYMVLTNRITVHNCKHHQCADQINNILNSFHTGSRVNQLPHIQAVTKNCLHWPLEKLIQDFEESSRLKVKKIVVRTGILRRPSILLREIWSLADTW